MNTISIKVNHEILTAELSHPLVAQSVGVTSFTAEFDESWDGYVKTIVFTAGDSFSRRKKAVLYTGGEMLVPWEVLEEPGELWISAAGVAEGVLQPTAIMREGLKIVTSGEISGEESGPATEEVWQQVLTEVSAIREGVENVEAAVGSAETAAETATAAAEVCAESKETVVTCRDEAVAARDAAVAAANKATHSVSAVNGVLPDDDGDVTITAEDVGALPAAGGAMTGTLNMSGQAITGLTDPAGDADAARKGYVDKVASGLIRPNLLDNWYFADPVNQRGQSSYSGNGYGIDRWRIASDAEVSVSVVSGGIEIVSDGSGSWINFEQGLETKFRTGMTVVASFLVDDASMVSLVYLQNEGYGYNYGQMGIENGLVQARFTIPEQWNGMSVVGIQKILSASALKILACKLELGETQTLAHKDAAGNWILNEIPNYGEQLIRCQRYFQVYATEGLRPTACEDFRPVMRTAPALSAITASDKTLYAASADL